ncbi:lipopolysaccharide transport periplasmic protein LptA [Castellaniella sp. S9]|uniref:lipopolysaccharide transport periplasmic protein LptA n=1 Tax=Castellaniella sp. S9 TaxID=2993652 RepID=UPI0022B5962A|nr:lipopolysaccharide transport periplasmic protein LptA [Castellaniella sp. S9]
MNKKYIAILAVLACLHAPAILAQASGTPAEAPPPSDTAPASGEAAEPDTLILSDTLHYDDVKKESTFTGNVVLTRGAMTLRSDKLVTREDADGYQYGTATADKAGLVHIRQENPEKFETIKASGVRAEYDGKTEEVTLIGQAVITRYICGKPFDNLRGARVIYHQKDGTYEAFGGADSAGEGGRVRSLTKPRAQADQAAAECRNKAPGQ